MRWLIPLLLTATLARADGEAAGEFDYYVLALSWSPSWCALEGDARESPQCDPARDFGWVMHGLWPQFHRGYPSYCQSSEAPPSRRMSAAMADIMGTSGSAWYQWKKHGICSGLSAANYYALAREAYERVTRPEVLRRLTKPVTLPAKLIEEAFIRANPGLDPDMITITCASGRIQEARLCLSRTLDPVPCGSDVVRDCRMDNALLDPVR
ncbi:ribonuclease T2 [Puniceibacterium sp. IMCC21224]|uniref:ribonuclease T2 family protein n=1 Tax=Puniceibacterium sp. IMCC21224 TaxID=1618204 RepID=UPI00064D9F6C|nr:ribonuclease T2 [Puniceibacterium sp. IMCC21224]KMK68406.1 ribonuclease I [Puniceibacterium sp. IMCC21224]